MRDEIKFIIIFAVISIIGGIVFGFNRGAAQGLPFFVKEPLTEQEVARPTQVPDEIIIKFKPGITEDLIEEFFKEKRVLEKHESKFAKFKVLKIPEGKIVSELVEIFEQSPLVEYAEPNYYVYTLWAPNDEHYHYQWHFDDSYKWTGKIDDPDRELVDGTNPYGGINGGGINIEPAWDISTGNSSIIVAVVDTGVAYENYSDSNPAGCYDILGRLKTCRPIIIDTYYQAPDLASTNFLISPGSDIVNSDDHPNDDEGHGTHVAGTIAQSTNNGLGIAGVAFNTTVMPVKVLDANGSGLSDGVADGIYFATDNGAKIINLSLGSSSPSITIENAVAYAYSQGVTVIAASGNEGADTVIYPAGYDAYVIAVGATQYDEIKAPYSNYGSSLDLVAPGGNTGVDQNNDGYADGVLQQTFGDNTSDFGYWFYQGTSMATPHVAGVAALLLSVKSDLTPDEVRNILETSAEDKGDSGWDQYYGWGVIDAYAALSSLPAVSISLSTDGLVDFGILGLGESLDTTSLGTNDVQTVSVDSGPANLDIKTTVFSDGAYSWSLSSTNGVDQVKWEFSNDGTNWTILEAENSLYSLATNLETGNAQDTYFRLTMPTETSSSNQYSSTVTIVATSP